MRDRRTSDHGTDGPTTATPAASWTGEALRPPKARTWSCIGVSPQVKVSGKGSGRVSVAGMVCAKPGERTRLIYRMLVHHPGRRGEKNGFKEQDFAELLDAAHQQLGGKIVLVWDNSTQHKDTLMRELLAARKQWLTVFRLPACAPDLNPAEGVWANLKNERGNLAASGPCSSARASHARQAGFIREATPEGPLERRASVPPLCPAACRAYADFRNTRNARATCGGFMPALNISAAWNRTRSRRARSTAVRPPPSDTSCHRNIPAR
ncbi:transposase [Streptomyces javensis]